MTLSEGRTQAREILEAAYRQTTYRVSGASGPVDIRIGIRNGSLDRLLEAHQVREWAFVTASNPGSRASPEHENARRNAELEQVLREAGLQYLHGSGVPDESGWQPERSYLVLGITNADAMAMAKRWGQRAIVWGSLGNAPKLAWTD